MLHQSEQTQQYLKVRSNFSFKWSLEMPPRKQQSLSVFIWRVKGQWIWSLSLSLSLSDDFFNEKSERVKKRIRVTCWWSPTGCGTQRSSSRVPPQRRKVWKGCRHRTAPVARRSEGPRLFLSFYFFFIFYFFLVCFLSPQHLQPGAGLVDTKKWALRPLRSVDLSSLWYSHASWWL